MIGVAQQYNTTQGPGRAAKLLMPIEGYVQIARYMLSDDVVIKRASDGDQARSQNWSPRMEAF